MLFRSAREFERADIRHKNKISDFEGHEIVGASKIPNKRQALRNCVNPEVGAHIIGCVKKPSQEVQLELVVI